jgi:hypothetical protein
MLHSKTPTAIIATPNAMFFHLNFKNGNARIIEIPIKCKIPNQMVSCGKIIKVAMVISMPKAKIPSPLFRK